MSFKVTITPKFDSKKIVDSTLKSFWFEFQAEAIDIGRRLHREVRMYINQNRHRTGGTGKLARSITFDKEVGQAQISWGIGNMDTMNQYAPYWYVINFGKMITGGEFIPGGGKFRPIRFDGSPADPSLRGRGTQRASFIISGDNVSPIRPINYIQYGQAKMQNEIATLIRQLKGFTPKQGGHYGYNIGGAR
jgi:hypothetical protein